MPPASLEDRLRATARQAAIETIQARGEPVAWPILHAAIHGRLAHTLLLAETIEATRGSQSPRELVAAQVQAALDSPVFQRLPSAQHEEDLWWLHNTQECQTPLSDRVELDAYQILEDTLSLTEADFERRIYAQFPGPLTPEAELVATCLQTFGHMITPGYWQLRTEDLPAKRQVERETIVDQLVTLGRRLGYRSEGQPPFDVAWFERDRVRAIFVVRWMAAVGEALALSTRTRGAIAYLVVPGGRGALVSYKLSHNPIWQRLVSEGNWRFIKYRHVRQLMDRSQVDEYALHAIVGLDPVVERESPQLALF